MKFKFFPFLFLLFSCSKQPSAKPTLFTDVTTQSGISFRNDLVITEQSNPYIYRSFFNGAGVAVGDINNDGLQDIYFAGNQVDNKLYLNKGNFQFEDITTSSGVACSGVWSTGVTFVDINADGLLDIYVCKSGNPEGAHRNNELFINNGDLTFTEKSKEYGLDFIGLSVHAAFFDYDKDGDLDCYLLTNSFKSVGNNDLVKDQRDIPDVQNGGNKFLLNESGKFRDHSKEVGIYRSSIGFGLGITLGDFNNDTWTDIFISNDFFERDYLYINDQKGSFKESLTDYFQSISMGSMGADYADMDNDGSPELFVTEMLPDSLSRKKSKTVYENWNKQQLNIENGYYHQFSRNVLQKKIGGNQFAEVGRMAGVAATEWSWGALLFDMDNDGKRDIFVANGIYKDLLDRDYLTYSGAEENVRKIIREEKNAIVKLIDLMPSSKFPNYAFKNNGHLSFSNMSSQWGLAEPMFSCGSAYGDFDNDGDLDLVVNNINAHSVVYRNNSDSSKFKSFSIVLNSKSQNRFAIGAQVTAYAGDKIFLTDNFVTRGYQSSVQSKITMGLGEGINHIDSLTIRWPNNGYSVLYDINVNQQLTIHQNETKQIDRLKVNPAEAFRLELVSNSIFKHNGNNLIDFNRERLLPMMYGNEMPSLIKCDINNDKIDEVYIGGGKEQAGGFVIMEGNEKFKFSERQEFNDVRISEETKGTFVDVDKDGDLDFYMANGGRFFPSQSSALIDKLFINNGKGQFKESTSPLPFTDFISTSVSKQIDFDNDGDLDLVVGERYKPFSYGSGGRGYLFQNNGYGEYIDVTEKHASILIGIGMITDIEVTDVDKDGWSDLMIVGDWMPIVFAKNTNGYFTNNSNELNLDLTEGWWHDIESSDLNGDGKPDFVVGNHGKNSFFKEGDRMYVSDFDKNGSSEQVFCTKVGDRYYPIVDKDEFLSQLPSMKRDLLYYKDYSKKSIQELFSAQTLKVAKVFQINVLSSILLVSNKEGYQQIELPLEAQYSPIYSVLIHDFDRDGIEDVIAGGNQYQVKPQFGRYDASSGWFFKGEKEGNEFRLNNGISLNVKGQIRDIEYIEIKGTKYIFFAKYDDQLEIYKIHR